MEDPYDRSALLSRWISRYTGSFKNLKQSIPKCSYFRSTFLCLGNSIYAIKWTRGGGNTHYRYEGFVLRVNDWYNCDKRCETLYTYSVCVAIQIQEIKCGAMNVAFEFNLKKQ